LAPSFWTRDIKWNAFAADLAVGPDPRGSPWSPERPTFANKGGPKEAFVPGLQEEVFLEGVRLQREGGGEVAGIWEPGHPEPLWIITDLSPQEALSIY